MYIGKIEEAVKFIEQTATSFTEMEGSRLPGMHLRPGMMS